MISNNPLLILIFLSIILSIAVGYKAKKDKQENNPLVVAKSNVLDSRKIETITEDVESKLENITLNETPASG